MVWDGEIRGARCQRVLMACRDGPVARLVTWSQYRESIGDRSDLLGPLADALPVERALYPGSYVDLSPSTAIRSVTYVDTDARTVDDRVWMSGYSAEAEIGAEAQRRTSRTVRGSFTTSA